MPFGVEDFQDLLRLLEEHPEWRAELRRHVLTEELLALPALARQLAESQVRTETRLEALAARMEQLAAAQERTQEQLATLTARVDQLAEAQLRTEARLEQLAEQLAALTARVDALTAHVDALAARVDQLAVQLEALMARVDALTARVDRLAEQLAALTARVDQLAEAQLRTEARLDALTARVDRLAEQLAALTARVDQLTEQLAALTARVDVLTVRMDQLAQAQARTEARLDALVTEVGTLKGKMLEIDYRERAPAYFARIASRLRVLGTAAVADLLETAVEQGTLTEQERDAVLAADLVLTGRRRTDRAAIYIVAEVSAGVGPHDVERAAERARILERLGRPVIAVVAGSAITAEAVARAAERKVWQVLDGQTITPPA